MTEQTTLQTPNEVLAKQIVARFIEANLATEEFSGKILELILSLSPSPEDWQLLAEKILESELKRG
jgi:hypothetical protein